MKVKDDLFNLSVVNKQHSFTESFANEKTDRNVFKENEDNEDAVNQMKLLLLDVSQDETDSKKNNRFKKQK